MIKFKVLRIAATEHTKHRVEVAAWEVPVLEALHGGENIEEVDGFTVDRDAPDAAEEFQRLAARYKKGDGMEVPYVASVYGNHTVGINALRAAITEATTEEQEDAVIECIVPITPAEREAARKAAKATQVAALAASKAAKAAKVKEAAAAKAKETADLA